MYVYTTSASLQLRLRRTSYISSNVNIWTPLVTVSQLARYQQNKRTGDWAVLSPASRWLSLPATHSSKSPVDQHERMNEEANYIQVKRSTAWL